MTELANGAFLKKLKYFEVMLIIFEFLWGWEIVESSLVYANKFSWFAQCYFSTEIKDGVSASLAYEMLLF